MHLQTEPGLTTLASRIPQVRAIYGVDIDQLVYKRGNGMQNQQPAGDLAGRCWDEERQEMR